MEGGIPVVKRAAMAVAVPTKLAAVPQTCTFAKQDLQPTTSIATTPPAGAVEHPDCGDVWQSTEDKPNVVVHTGGPIPMPSTACALRRLA